MTKSKIESLARRGLDLVMSGDPAQQKRGNQLISDALEQEPEPVEHLQDHIKAESAVADGDTRAPGPTRRNAIEGIEEAAAPSPGAPRHEDIVQMKRVQPLSGPAFADDDVGKLGVRAPHHRVAYDTERLAASAA